MQNVVTVVLHHALEGAQVCEGPALTVHDGFDIAWVRQDAFMCHYVSQILNGCVAELILVWRCLSPTALSLLSTSGVLPRFHCKPQRCSSTRGLMSQQVLKAYYA